ncbi:MAG: 16S rRNA (cytosine(1402)-N(4))-methyltransferase, partial [Spirochaetales bacterium]|nr:16S rRNA (cytosine(1402)-N(4))-methyltransferase [Spirochaetales bacterium]
MLDHTVECFAPLPANARICDATLGGGGHTARLLELCPSCTVVAIDADRVMVQRAEARFGSDPRLSIVHGWFDEVLGDLSGLDRIIMDIGVSMFHLREPERGFSVRDDGPLDMRLDTDGSGETAEMLLRRLNERELADVIFRYGEERYARRIARAVVRERGAGIA